MARRPLGLIALVCAGAVLLSGCGRNMHDQPRAEWQEASAFFDNGAAARPLIDGTVSRERGAIDPAFYSGQGDAGLLTELPVELSLELLQRGQERYNIYCSPCHNYSGNGRGMIVQKGFVQPASFHEERLRQAPVGYFYNAISNGFGRMYSYASRIPPEDRWAISGYIRALQLSQNASTADIPEAVLRELETDQIQGATR